MAKQKKKGTSGQAKNYITRTQAVRKLQISLPDFRRLCIFKGIYPREPRNIKKANKSATHSTTFYYTKDIQYLLHEPLLAKLRDQKALQKKIAKSLGRNEVQDALRLEKHGMPKIKLDHIVRERYPTFQDALRDLDDALTLLFLFANLPSTDTVPPKVIARCQRLCHEFEHYLITAHALKKSFLSIKGIYYQATVQGQDIMWLVPYKFVQQVTQDVDYRIMGTFVEFYCTLLGFVNFKLYTSIGLVYPPRFDSSSDERGAELAAFTLEGRNVGSAQDAAQITNGTGSTVNTGRVQAVIDRIAHEAEDQAASEQLKEELAEEVQDDNEGGVDRFEVTAPEADELPQAAIDRNTASALFSEFTIFISREAPRHPVEFLLRAFGCKRLGWDKVLGEGAFTFDEQDPRITHQIVDKPQVGSASNVQPGLVAAGRIYVQPQWIWDSINEGELQQTDMYAPGETLPPHLSPWMKPVKGQYDPRASLAEQQLEGEDEEELSDDEVQELLEDAEPDQSESEDEFVDGAAAGMTIDVADDMEVDDQDASDDANGEFGGFGDDDEEESDDDAQTHQAELMAEATGKAASTGRKTKSSAEQRKQQRLSQEKQESEQIERQKMMMSNKKRKLYEKMQYSNNVKDAEAEKLRKKRRKLEQKQRK